MEIEHRGMVRPPAPLAGKVDDLYAGTAGPQPNTTHDHRQMAARSLAGGLEVWPIAGFYRNWQEA
jgi:hypothetical protein